MGIPELRSPCDKIGLEILEDLTAMSPPLRFRAIAQSSLAEDQFYRQPAGWVRLVLFHVQIHFEQPARLGAGRPVALKPTHYACRGRRGRLDFLRNAYAN